MPSPKFRLSFVYLLLASLAIFIPEGSISTITSLAQPQASVLGADKTPPASIKYTPNPPLETKSETLTIKGNAEAESTVEVYLNDNLFQRLSTGNKSKFSLDLPLSAGANSFWFKVIDQAGNEGASSGSHSVTRTNS